MYISNSILQRLFLFVITLYVEHNGPPQDVIYLPKNIWKITQQIPKFACEWFRKELKQQQKVLSGNVYSSKEVTDSPCFTETGEMLKYSHLRILQLLPALFPVTDLEHPVTTPATLLMSQCLTQSTISKPKDILLALLVALILLQVTYQNFSTTN